LFVLHEAKDALWLVDDYVLAPSGKEREKQDKQADNLVRGVANQTGRGRLNRNGKPQADRPPRALLLVTGEDRSEGHSKAARTVFTRFRKGSIDTAKLTAVQKEANAGVFTQAMAGYLQWLAPQYSELQGRVERRIAELRPEFDAEERHKRTAENLASLAVGFEMFLEYTQTAQALSQGEAQELWKRFVETMKQVGAEQDELQKTEDPITESIRILKGARSGGHIWLEYADKSLAAAQKADLDAVGVAYPPGSIEIGQLDEDGSWMCLPDDLYSALQKLYGRLGRTFPKSKDEYLQELRDRELTEAASGRTTKRAPRSWRSTDESRPWVVYFPARVFDDGEVSEDGEAE
jgi:hypothetical protein